MQLLQVHQRGTRADQPGASTVPNGTLYYVTDELLYEEAIGGQWLDISTSTAPPPPSSQALSYVVFGGQVTWQSGLTFVVSASTYYIQGVKYTSVQQTVTLDAADASNDRLDIIALDTTGTAVAITGTAQANPSAPTSDPTTQLDLTIISIPANATTPPISTVALYAENAGAPAEWNWTTSGSGIVVNSATTPRTGSTCIRGIAMASGAYAQGASGGAGIDINNYSQLVFYIRNASAWGNGRTLRIRWFISGTGQGNTITIQNNAWGFSSTDTTTYQVIALDTILFAVPKGTLVNQIRIIDNGGSLSFGIDDVSLIANGGGSIGSTGITQAEADARYVQLGNATATDLQHITDLAVEDGASTARITDQLFAGSNISFTESDESGAITISSTGGGVTDHGALTGLANDDHTQYLLASDATDRTTFAADWIDLTDGGSTTLHSHSGSSEATDVGLLDGTSSARISDLIFAGSNVSFTESDESGALTISATFTSSSGGFGYSDFTSPPTTNWSWDNQGSATLDSQSAYQAIQCGADGGASVHMRYRTAPSAPYVLTAFISGMALGSGATAPSNWIALRDSGTGKIIAFGFYNQAGAPEVEILYWNSSTSFNSTNVEYKGAHHHTGWLRITDNNTNHLFDISNDGVNWLNVSTISRTNFLATPDQIGFGIRSDNPASCTLISWVAA